MPSFTDLVVYSLGIIIPTLWVLAWRKAHRARRLSPEPSEPIDFKLLNEAEAESATGPSLLEQYSQHLVPVGKFTVLHGFTTEQMDQAISELEAKGVAARWLFNETMPTGVMTVHGPSGFYQIWVTPENRLQTEEFLQHYFPKR